MGRMHVNDVKMERIQYKVQYSTSTAFEGIAKPQCLPGADALIVVMPTIGAPKFRHHNS